MKKDLRKLGMLFGAELLLDLTEYSKETADGIFEHAVKWTEKWKPVVRTDAEIHEEAIKALGIKL